MINIINNILISRDIQNNYDTLIKYIPEIKCIVGFQHNHPHHHLDVWNHTLEAIKNVDSNDTEILMALLLHDIGKPFSYQEGEVRHFHGHPDVSASMTKRILDRLGYNDTFINNVVYLVKTHDTMIDVDNLDNTYEMIIKRLTIQYADAKAHAPNKVQKKLNLLNEIKEKLNNRKKLVLKNNNS